MALVTFFLPVEVGMGQRQNSNACRPGVKPATTAGLLPVCVAASPNHPDCSFFDSIVFDYIDLSLFLYHGGMVLTHYSSVGGLL